MRTRLRPIALTLLLILSTPPSSMAQSIALPDIGDPAQQYLSPEKERRLGAATLQQIREHNLVIEDVQLNEYLNSIGQSVAAYAQNQGNPFTFFLVRDTSINAFAAPGGFIGVNSGLLLTTQTEDELAGVLAHEIAHVNQGHITRGYADAQNMRIPMAAALLASALVAAAAKGQAGQAALMGTMAASVQHQINFTRANEQEADRIGTRILAQAGFDPNGMTKFFGRLERLSSGSAAQIPEFLRTHPLPSNRMADTEDRFKNSVRRSNRDSAAYHLAKARIRALTTLDNGALLQQFETALAKAAYADEAAERYGYALALKQAGRYDDALRQITRLRNAHPDRLAFRLEEAEIALAKGDRATAWRLFEDAQRLYADDFTLAMHYGQALAVQGDPRKAMEILQPHLRRRSSDASLHTLYAQAARRAGDIAVTHATLAEYYYLNGELKQAIEQAELGVKSPGATPYQQAQLRARLRQFKEEVAAQ